MLDPYCLKQSKRMMEKDQEIWYTSVGQSARQTGIGRERREKFRDPAGFRVFQGMG